MDPVRDRLVSHRQLLVIQVPIGFAFEVSCLLLSLSQHSLAIRPKSGSRIVHRHMARVLERVRFFNKLEINLVERQNRAWIRVPEHVILVASPRWLSPVLLLRELVPHLKVVIDTLHSRDAPRLFKFRKW